MRKSLQKNGASLQVYIHVPFCHAKCAYCDFYSTPRAELMERWADALLAEWERRVGRRGFVPQTVYLGGGTPSSLPVELLDRILHTITPASELREFTIEANPEDVTAGWVDFIKNHTSIDRVSMGVQSLDDSQLAFIGRRHTAREAIDAYNRLRDGGIEKISLDLIYGLPGQTLDSWKLSLDTLLSLRPEHLSAYLLSYEPRTRLGVMLDKGRVTEASEELVTQMYGYLCEATREAGYSHYEISNFALPGCEAVHNSGYWNSTPYIGLGPGAHSFVDGRRGANPPNLHDYILKNGDVYAVEDETDTERLNDLVITALRTSRGLDLWEIETRFPGLAVEFKSSAQKLIDAGELMPNHLGHLVIPEDKWLISNSILLKLIMI